MALGTTTENNFMTTYTDKRGLTLAHETSDKSVLLDDETAEAYSKGDYPMNRFEISGIDVERMIFEIGGVRGARLGDLSLEAREKYRAKARRLIEQ